MAYEILPKKLRFLYKSYKASVTLTGKTSWLAVTKNNLQYEDIPGYTPLIISLFGTTSVVDTLGIGEHVLNTAYEWIPGASYSVGNIVNITKTSGHNTTVSIYKCATANSDTVFNPDNWTREEDMTVYFVRIRGNGTSSSTPITANSSLDILWARDDLVSIIPYKAPTT